MSSLFSQRADLMRRVDGVYKVVPAGWRLHCSRFSGVGLKVADVVNERHDNVIL